MKAVKNNPENDFLIRALTIANDQIKLAKVFETNEVNKSFTYSDEHLNEVGQQIAENIKGRYNNGILYFSNETQNYSICLQNNSTETLLSDLKKSISKTWATPKISGFNLKYDELNPKNWQGLAENQFNSADEILERDDYLRDCENLEQAQNNLSKYQTEQPTNTKAIADLTKLVIHFEQFVKVWFEVYKIGCDTDYVRLAEIKKERAINKLANESEPIKAMIEGNDYFLKYVSPRQIYDLFKSFDVEPVNDIDLYFSLKTAETINTETSPDTLIWNEAHDQVIDKKPGGFKFLSKLGDKNRSFDNYLLKLQMDAKNNLCKFKDDYLKVNGDVKKMSHRKRMQMYQDDNKLKQDDKFIGFVIKNEKTIVKHIVDTKFI